MLSNRNADSNVIAVYTREPASAILAAGGTQAWVLDRSRAARCEYIICCRRATGRTASSAEQDRTAFLIGTVKDVVPSPEAKDRWLILIGEYELIHFPDLFTGRNPVSYLKVSDFDRVDFEQLRLQPLAKLPPALTIAEAKAGLARGLNVAESAIEIIVRG